MGHIEYASPECVRLRDIVTYETAGDALLLNALRELHATEQVSFIKNNIDHYTGATFGCHENYLMRRETQFTPPVLGTLLCFLATRQIYTGAGRIGQAHPLAFDFDLPPSATPVRFQISQRADHIVNDIYQWVQFNRAISMRRESICKVETRRSIGYLRAGVLFLILLRRTQMRLSAASIGLRSDGCWGSSPKPNLFRGMIRGCSVSIWSITTSIHRVD